MAQAETPIARRSLFAAVALLPAFGAVAPTSQDAQFLAWERELARIEAIPSASVDDDTLNDLCDQAADLTELIRKTRSSSPVAARAKLRTLLAEVENFDRRWTSSIEDVLQCLGAA